MNPRKNLHTSMAIVVLLAISGTVDATTSAMFDKEHPGVYLRCHGTKRDLCNYGITDDGALLRGLGLY